MWHSLPTFLVLVTSFTAPTLTFHHVRGVHDVNLRPRARVEPQGVLANATKPEIEEARKLVEEVQKKMAVYRHARFSNPRRNLYHAEPGNLLSKRDVGGQGDGDLALPVEFTPEVEHALSLVAEADAAAGPSNNLTLSARKQKRAQRFWMESIDHSKGTVPWGDDPGYKVFRNVIDYGADPTGKKDSYKAIQEAMMDGKRCGDKCNGSTLKNAIVYFPPGQYLVSRQIDIPMGTQVIGDANDWPTLMAARLFADLAVLSTNKYVGGPRFSGPDKLDPQWYVSTARFYSQIRNFKIDITGTRDTQYDREVACIHYQVAQATSLENVELIAKTGKKYMQVGIFAENGSGGSMSDVKFKGGWRGFCKFLRGQPDIRHIGTG